MKILSKLMFLLLLYGSVCAQESPTQSSHERKVFESFHSSVSILRETTLKMEFQNSQAAEVKAWLNSIENDTRFLQEVVQSQPHMKIPGEYWSSLKDEAELLESISKPSSQRDLNQVRVYQILGITAADLDIKAAHAKSSMGSSLRLVKVLVRSMNSKGGEVNGYRLWFVPRGWADTANRYQQSQKLSSPVVIDVAPGTYVMWLTKAAITSKRNAFSIGANGTSESQIDLEIP